MAKGSRRTTPCWPAEAAVVSLPMVAAMYTPSAQVRASVTSGTVVLRRPPKMKASMGTPFSSSHCASSAGLLVAATVKREFGCAAGRGLPPVPPAAAMAGVQSRPCQSMRWAGGVSVMPSHHTSPSSVSATLVKIVSWRSEARQLGLVCSLVPGATPK